MDKLKVFYSKYLHGCLALCALLAFALNLTIEALARQSIGASFDFLADKPLVFFYNVLIIFTTLSLALLTKRRIFVYILLSGLWLALGITNGVILQNRMTPFTTKDLSVMGDGLSLLTNYLTVKEIVLVVGGVILLIALLVVLFFFAPKQKMRISKKRNFAVFLAICLSLFGITNLAMKTEVVDTFFGNLAYAYRDNGVPYCFITTWLNTGIKMPPHYSEEAVSLISQQEEEAEAETKSTSIPPKGDKPNIIMLQLESFIDPTRINGITLSEDPVPTFRDIFENYSSGYLTVPALGAGTANTEFEVLTGMSVKFFGPGEYPYKSILMKETCESAAYDLKELGYSAHAIHNHRGAFYGRNKVFANLGFDTFTSIEYMNKAAKTPRNWVKDRVLTSQIMDALTSTDEQDYIYTISVQGHGKYPETQVIAEPRITVQAPSESLKWQYEYYVNQLYEMDLFIKDLTSELSRYPEDVVLVMYGDHLPALEMTEKDMKTGSLYETQYVMWSNYKMEKRDEDLPAFQLTSEVLDRLGIHEGTMFKFHQDLRKESPSYLADLRMLEYDILYGKRYVYGGVNPFSPTKLQMGVNPIKIEEVVEINNNFYIKGQNFTEYSKISLDGEILKTIYLGPSILGLQQPVSPDDVDRMKISQVEKNKEILSTTE